MVARQLCDTFNVFVSTGRGGPIVEEFLRDAFAGTTEELDALDLEYLLHDLVRLYGVGAILLNSVETFEVASAALVVGVPTVALIHEFAEYTRPPGRMAVAIEAVDRAIVPANIVLQSIQAEMKAHRGAPTNNIGVRPQGYLPELPQSGERSNLSRGELETLLGFEAPREFPIVLGAGMVQIRKGVDLFIQTADRYVKTFGTDVRFVWVGDGFNPTEDLQYSVWLADSIKRLGLEGVVYFVRSQSNLATLYEMASVFYLSSRLDPFPNVVLDCFKIGKPVVCFSDATGIADFLDQTDRPGAAVPFFDMDAAAAAIHDQILRSGKDVVSDRRVNAPGKPSDPFDFSAYVAFLEQQLTLCKGDRLRLLEILEELREPGRFDPSFHDGTDMGHTEKGKHRSALLYAARTQKGLYGYNPAPGVNERRLRASSVASAERREGAARYRTHEAIDISLPGRGSKISSRVALHVHLHYAELTDEFVRRLESTPANIDIFVTTNDDEAAASIAYGFKGYRNGRVTVSVVPNRGRDIAPLVVYLKNSALRSRYDVVGHLHGKRTVDLPGPIGNDWRTFLLDTLLGDRHTLERILGLFEDRDEVGLVFAEDHHCVGWTKNLEIAQRLAARLDPVPSLPVFPVFPLGTMFWCRPSVLEPLWQLDLKVEDFPSEPLPYDGTLAHALERTVPAICESVGLRWMTVYKGGVSW
jgi:glycosyltransferase involved in cell wall biosynthesis